MFHVGAVVDYATRQGKQAISVCKVFPQKHL